MDTRKQSLQVWGSQIVEYRLSPCSCIEERNKEGPLRIVCVNVYFALCSTSGDMAHLGLEDSISLASQGHGREPRGNAKIFHLG